MKRIILIALCLLLGASLLAGCDDGYPEGKTLTFADLQITLPGDFINLSEEAYAQDADLLCGRNTLIVKGMEEKKADLQVTTLEQYTGLVIAGNKLTCTPEVYGKGYLFSYETPVGDTKYTYVTATFESAGSFWVFQFYCPSENLKENQPEIDIILSGIRVNY